MGKSEQVVVNSGKFHTAISFGYSVISCHVNVCVHVCARVCTDTSEESLCERSYRVGIRQVELSHLHLCTAHT